MLTFFFAVILLCVPIRGLIPQACARNFSNSPFTCCPIPKGYSQPCGYPLRGRCMPAHMYESVQKQNKVEFMTRDIRFQWPSRIFKNSCVCNNLYWGPDCGDCWFGYEGKECNQRIIRTRKDITSYNKTERQQFSDVLIASRNVTAEYLVPNLHVDQIRWSGEFQTVDVFEFGNFVHIIGAYPILTHNHTECYLTDIKGWDYAHTDVLFPQYHRYLMLLYEKMLRQVAATYYGLTDFTLPYWDWTNKQSCEVCVDDLIGAKSDEYDDSMHAYFISNKSAFGQISKWPIFCQMYAKRSGLCEPCHINRSSPQRMSRAWTSFDFPTVDEVIDFLRLDHYTDYEESCQSAEMILEGGYGCTCQWNSKPYVLHTKPHRYLEGTFKPMRTSIFDPFFFLHHIQVDRLLERWFRRYNPSVKTFSNVQFHMNGCRDCYIPSFFPLVIFGELFVQSFQLGYTYDNLNFGSLSEDVEVGHWSNSFKPKKCPKYIPKVY